MQRFFAIIELASSPFIPGVGPAQFVGENDVFVPASNVQSSENIRISLLEETTVFSFTLDAESSD